ncbi:MAG TPA: transglycosylase SLT domain-containing protein [Solirubrobacteraceae bacterium]|nr:transglycosylase SLT domain-containing protein [Solirubrobacteraceae bacterium]
MSAPRRPARRGPARRTRGLLWGAGLGPAARIRSRGCRGQASVLLVGGLAGVLIGALVLGMVARGLAHEGAAQRAADLSALAGARAMREAYPRLFEPASVDGRPNPLHLDRAKYLELGRAAARATAERNGAVLGEIAFPDHASFAPVRIRVVVRGRVVVERGGARRSVGAHARATAELAPLGPGGLPAGGGYDGPLEQRQGKPMRPDVAQAFDRMERAARADGVTLLITSAYRSDAEQAVLWRRHPDPRWVARPGESLHRYGTELDLGPPAAYAWLAAHADEFHFLKRYPHEPWHFGYVLNARSTPRATDGGAAGSGAAGPGDGRAARALPSFVPAEFAPALARAAQRWNVSAALLAAQLYAESNFNPFATSPMGAQGIAQFMPETARAMGLADPFDAEQAIDAQARLMRDLLRRFAAVPLALAAYNAGPGPVEACGCVPPYPETRGYVARILGLLGGMGELSAGTVVVRLVE